MNNGKNFFTAGNTRVLLGLVLIGILTGCYADRPRPESVAPPTVVMVADDYIYYPYYQTYYSSGRRQFAYRQGNTWVAQPGPSGVPLKVLLASPAVTMDFHDAPVNHHAAVVQQYPKDWTPPAQTQGQNENHKNNKGDQHGDNNGR